jgi:hypothetical protein
MQAAISGQAARFLMGQNSMPSKDLGDPQRYQEALGEWAYTMMYEASSSTRAAGYYSDAKEAFAEAIRLATDAGRAEDAARLEQRLEHIKAVFRSQFA